MKKISSLSIVLPCYNEELNIEKSVLEAIQVAEVISNTFEIIVVNDGSTDSSKDILENLSSKNKELMVINQENQGYGGAIKNGFSMARYEWIFFTDSDRQFELGELKEFIQFTDSYDFIFGFRENRADKFHRLVIAQMLKIWNYLFLGFPTYIKDIDCAFKLMKRSSFEKTYPIYSSGAMINTEFILKINKLGYKIKQIPVSHKPRVAGKSTGSNISVILKAVKETFELMKVIHR
jgi:glycosyltransferase involved in cell wall biosynthesis